MTFTPPPTPPNSGDPANFNARADAFLGWMAQFASEIDAAGYPSIPLSLPNGTAAAPALAFASQPNTGFYRPSTSVLALSINGTERARFTTSGLEVTGTIRGTGAENLPALISAASDTGIVSTTHLRSVLASTLSRSLGARSAIIASDGCEVPGARSASLASWQCNALGGRAAVIGSLDSVCDTSAQGAVIASRATLNNVNGSLAMGNGSSSTQADASAANRTIHLYGTNGNIQIAGSLTSSHTFSDFAEMFPNVTGVEIPLGTIVAEEGGAVRPAGPGDEIAGVVTATAVVTAGDTPFAWQGRYLSDEWGQPIMEEILDPDWEADLPDPSWQPDPDGPEDQQPALMANPQPQQMISVQKENPAWNPAAPQVPRSERPDEWTRVGLLGQVFTRVAADVVPGDKLSAVDGVGVKSTARTGLRCMTITQPYDAAKGYAVARCLINVQV